MDSLPPPYQFTPLTAAHRREVTALDALIFPSPHSVDDLLTAPDSLEWERMWGIRVGAVLAGVHGTYSLARYPVPGSHARCGWLTWVGVHPEHRRRGLLRAMVKHHLRECREAGESISGLFAAEPGIYGRFGYGMASRHATLTVPRQAALRPVPGSAALDIEITDFSSGAHANLISEVHARAGGVGLGRPGWATWETPGLKESRTIITPALTAGKEPLRILLARSAGEPGTAGELAGYATFRRTLSWEPAGPHGTVTVEDFAALTPAATHRMWSILFDLDLTTEVTTPMLAVDDPLLELLVDIRRAQPRFQDNTWLRIVDLPRALTARKLTGRVDTTLDVTDSLIPENSGTWRIQGEAWEHPEITASTDPAHVSLDVRELSATYLGGISLMQSLNAGLGIVHNLVETARLAQALTWLAAPVANWVF